MGTCADFGLEEHLRDIKLMTAELHLVAPVSHCHDVQGTLEWKRATVDVIKSDTCFFYCQKE